jgi:hypothetical protein
MLLFQLLWIDVKLVVYEHTDLSVSKTVPYFESHRLDVTNA